MKRINKNIFLTIGTVILINPLNTFALTKDETVYAKLNNNGTVKSIIASEHLINDEKEKNIKDFSTLKNINNVNGDETFENKDNILTWNSNKNDIYYQGNINKELPISTKVTYRLNGKLKKLKSIIGKKGHITINIEYTNNLSNNINGKILYTPFLVATETNISTKNNSNVSITNGKVISTGTNNVLIGISSPGLSKSLELNELNNLNNIIIEYDTKKFSKLTMYSVATSKLIDESDLKGLNNNTIYNEINNLTNAATKIVEGIKTLNEGSNDLLKGSKSAYKGTLAIKEAVDKSIKSTENDKGVALTNEQVEGIKKQVLSKFTSEYILGIELNAENTLKNSENYKQIEQKYNNGLTNASLTDEIINECIKPTINTSYQSTCDLISTNINTYPLISTKQLMNAMIEVAKETAISTAKQTAVSTAEEISIQVANNVKQIATTKTLESLKLLSNNLGNLSDGLKHLNDGTEKLSIGTNELYEGVNQFNETGIKKISNMVNVTLKGKVDTVKELTKLSNNYNSFSGKLASTKGQTKFIMIIK